jgi:hypothetical protein
MTEIVIPGLTLALSPAGAEKSFSHCMCEGYLVFNNIDANSLISPLQLVQDGDDILLSCLEVCAHLFGQKPCAMNCSSADSASKRLGQDNGIQFRVIRNN